MGDILKATMDQHKAQRLYELDRRQDGKTIQGKFEGSVAGTWKQLSNSGGGIVEYKGKDFVTRPIGFTSISKGAAVELSHADGVYYSKW
jgi:hypothetical protein